MGLYNFQKQFVPFIKARTKKHTIRSRRAHPDKPGNTLYLYSGLRTKKARRIIAPVKCVKVEEINIEWSGGVLVEGIRLSDDEREALAKRDGFAGWAEMFEFWRSPVTRLPFEGHIIHWK